ncbi:protein kinase-like domain, Phloem protein 2-like protein [Artemisia annua]|uniref:non-specific serine/threonine protein kinase n=1 Tax=Artemisia annua TaxID=35608 RepID=A0A2U1QHS7_ARTAN|nr:protein kinase-like domain, Phloem protein 2-like protein [Artemisia annua]
MDSFTNEFKHLVIKLEDIKSATNNFDEKKVIGGGGFGKVYKGEVSHYKGRSMVAFKRLDHKFGQGDPEFWKEIMMLSRYTHENLISLLGYCNEGGEMILVYEHASNGSLDFHLSSTTLTWTQRIKICLDAARGLSYLHDDKGTQQRVLHRDIKSPNILLDENWNAKVSDMGLSKLGPANQQHTALMTTAVGTPGCCDPLYMELGYLITKESDVYSFGVVLLEVLFGKLCYVYINAKLEIALADQEIYEKVKLPTDYKEIIKTAVPALNYGSEEELKKILLKGTLLNSGKRIIHKYVS